MVGSTHTSDRASARAALRSRVEAKIHQYEFVKEEAREARSLERRHARLAALARAGGKALARAERTPGVRQIADLRYGDGPRRTLDVYRPCSNEWSPLVFFFYGGAWRSGSKDDVAFVGWALARLGFVVVVPDHRLVPEVRFPAFLEDAAQAVAWIQKNSACFGADAGRSLLMGHSAGAHTAMMLGLDPRYLSDAGASAEGVRGLIGLSGPYDFYPFPLNLCVDAFGSAPDPHATQPVNFVTAEAPPVLLATGRDDRHVPPENTVSMTEALAACGARHHARYYDNVDHLGMLLSFSRFAGARAPVVRDFWRFARAVGACAPYRSASRRGAVEHVLAA